jgi:hypothetical protein
MRDFSVVIEPLLEPFGNSGGPASRRCMLEIFFEKCEVLFLGTTDKNKAKRKSHTHIGKVRLLNGLFATPDLYSALYLIIDIWDQNFESFHKFARSPSEYGGFDSPFLRHQMTEQASIDTAWYQAACDKPLEHLPKFARFLSTARSRGENGMTSQKRAELETRAAAMLEAAHASHRKWNGTTWTQPRHLLGLLCSEARRGWFASDLLARMGFSEKLKAALAEAGQEAIPQPKDAVDRVLQQHLIDHWTDGSMQAELALWKIGERAAGLGSVRRETFEPPACQPTVG